MTNRIIITNEQHRGGARKIDMSFAPTDISSATEIVRKLSEFDAVKLQAGKIVEYWSNGERHSIEIEEVKDAK